MQGKKDEFVASLTYQQTTKKGLVLTRNEDESVTKENFSRVIKIEHILPDALKQTEGIFANVFVPLMKSEKNHFSCPKVIKKDMCAKMERLCGLVSAFVGQTKGNTILAVPFFELTTPLEELSDEEQRNLVHQMETYLTDWIREIKYDVDNTSEKALNLAEKRKEHFGPLKEIDFWRARLSNLMSLKEQLSNEKIMKILDILGKLNSNYVSGFNTMQKKLEEGFFFSILHNMNTF